MFGSLNLQPELIWAHTLWFEPGLRRS
jgi:hypothetical protein